MRIYKCIYVYIYLKRGKETAGTFLLQVRSPAAITVAAAAVFFVHLGLGFVFGPRDGKGPVKPVRVG
jgi:hypothetical protein